MANRKDSRNSSTKKNENDFKPVTGDKGTNIKESGSGATDFKYLRDDIRTEIEYALCLICGTFFEDPQSFPCGHSFCRKCVGKEEVLENPRERPHLTTFVCPIDHNRFVPVDDMQPNFALEKIVHGMRKKYTKMNVVRVSDTDGFDSGPRSNEPQSSSTSKKSRDDSENEEDTASRRSSTGGRTEEKYQDKFSSKSSGKSPLHYGDESNYGQLEINVKKKKWPTIFQPRIKVNKSDAASGVRICIFGDDDSEVEYEERVVMLIGSTGSGKTTLLNAICNYLGGYSWEENTRFQLVTEDDEGQNSQSVSQTNEISVYKFPLTNRMPIKYALTVIDTPGFGDTRGLERDKHISDQIRTLFKMKRGPKQLDAIGFVIPSGLARLSPTQKYIYNSLVESFGKNMERSIIGLFTFADGPKPQAKVALDEAHIPLAAYFVFNNSAVYIDASDKKDENYEFNKMFWDMGNRNLQQFLDQLEKMKPVSVELSTKVLEERSQVEAAVAKILLLIRTGVSMLEEIESDKQTLKKYQADIERSRDFKVKVRVYKQRPRPGYTRPNEGTSFWDRFMSGFSNLGQTFSNCFPGQSSSWDEQRYKNNMERFADSRSTDPRIQSEVERAYAQQDYFKSTFHGGDQSELDSHAPDTRKDKALSTGSTTGTSKPTRGNSTTRSVNNKTRGAHSNRPQPPLNLPALTYQGGQKPSLPGSSSKPTTGQMQGDHRASTYSNQAGSVASPQQSGYPQGTPQASAYHYLDYSGTHVGYSSGHTYGVPSYGYGYTSGYPYGHYPNYSYYYRQPSNNYEVYQEEEEVPVTDMLNKYTLAKGKYESMKDIFSVADLLQRAIRYRIYHYLWRLEDHLKKLSKIALKVSAVNVEDYIEKLIQTETELKEPGWSKRVEELFDAKSRVPGICTREMDPWEYLEQDVIQNPESGGIERWKIVANIVIDRLEKSDFHEEN